ncbi:L-proline glycine betaine binding ABC transporter protein ProX / Osmotic adaptation [Candidatus Kuenenia stuttgartiensis]|uniref:L-proline glycine betaine binding ABC transporter protein ProX / Osmotic adaptation n=1 Tax=Kuenenia stuttgartiensis TaxID=174633 RepID=Q1Q765_KUEST|nr:L-proline glycine betaine binding ABC transporter protein ProX / Osmotic adaptation [Candidatus Kuenenia stuttgartiensis]CAJ73424.1 similar to membrane protein component of ABC transporter for proline or glycine betaine [Candidatus Kuenenia stuttgartiensis]
MKTYFFVIYLFLCNAVFAYLFPLTAYSSTPKIKIGSKKFTESVILGEIVNHLLKSTGEQPIYLRELGGTRVLWNALLKGEIDIYPEYTGTISEEILAGEEVHSEEEIRQALIKRGIKMTDALGFNNTYAIGMKEEVAEKLKIRKISDLQRHPDLKFGFGNEFMDRGDGWPILRRHYNLPQQNVRGLDHDLAYRGLEKGIIQAIDTYSTDAKIRYYNLRLLEDDMNHFPAYNAVILYRSDLEERAPHAVTVLKKIENKISRLEMVKMNFRANMEMIPENRIAADFLSESLSLETESYEETAISRLLRLTTEHLYLVTISLSAAILTSIPLGIVSAKRTTLGQIILAIVGVLQTIPSLALLVFMIPLLGIGGPPAITALFLYSLLPIVRNTYTGLHDIPSHIQESAEALGLPPGARLRLVELPMASRPILAGIKTSAVINVGTATLGALIGAGGYGQLILTGIRLDNISLILQGAVPAAVLALIVQGGFEALERFFVPKGLRLKPTV